MIRPHLKLSAGQTPAIDKSLEQCSKDHSHSEAAFAERIHLLFAKHIRVPSPIYYRQHSPQANSQGRVPQRVVTI